MATTAEIKPTQTPWKVDRTKERILSESGHMIATFWMTERAKQLLYEDGREDGESWINYRERTSAERQHEAAVLAANVEFVIRAVNSHDELLAALKRIAAPRNCGCLPVCQCNSPESLCIEVDALRDIAIAAITKAEKTL